MPEDWNQTVIDDFHANHGKVGGQFEGAPLLLLHHLGAKTNAERVTPMMYQAVPGGYAVFASKGGAPSNPDWFHNLRAHTDAQIEVGDDTIPVVARVVEGAEREQIWEKQKRDYPGFAEYEQKTSRTIPVVVLEPAS